MLASSGRKARDDYIGGRDFSRVRRFDDEARKARIFAPDAPIALDVSKVEEQLKEKEEQRHHCEVLLKEDERRQALEKQCWDKEDEELRRQRVQARAALEECWTKQHEEFRERWKHRPYELNREKVGLLPAKRYQFQDEEVLREAEVVRRVSEAWRQQIEDHNSRLHQEMENRKQNDMQTDIERKNWEKAQMEIARDLFNANLDLANEYLRQSQEKKGRDKQMHDKEHSCGITKDFFAQFQTTSR